MNPQRSAYWKGMLKAEKEMSLIFAEAAFCKICSWKFRLLRLDIHHRNYEHCY